MLLNQNGRRPGILSPLWRLAGGGRSTHICPTREEDRWNCQNRESTVWCSMEERPLRLLEDPRCCKFALSMQRHLQGCAVRQRGLLQLEFYFLTQIAHCEFTSPYVDDWWWSVWLLSPDSFWAGPG